MHTEISDELRKRLTLYALGMLEGDDAESLGWHLTQGCASCDRELRALRETAASVALAGPMVTPPMGLRERMLAEAAPEAPHVVRRNEGEWKRVSDSVWVKPLFEDREAGRVTSLVRIGPRGCFSEHRHEAPEQYLVVEGTATDGGRVLEAGDFICLPAGSSHSVVAGDEGCLLLVVSSGPDEMLPIPG